MSLVSLDTVQPSGHRYLTISPKVTAVVLHRIGSQTTAHGVAIFLDSSALTLHFTCFPRLKTHHAHCINMHMHISANRAESKTLQVGGGVEQGVIWTKYYAIDSCDHPGRPRVSCQFRFCWTQMQPRFKNMSSNSMHCTADAGNLGQCVHCFLS